MRIYIGILVLLVTLACAACQTQTESIIPTPSISYSQLPVSDAVEVPNVGIAIGIESGDLAVSWTPCKGAIKYEVEKKSSNDMDWTLIYSGSDCIIELGSLPSGTVLSFRGRAVYTQVVSQWSEPCSIP